MPMHAPLLRCVGGIDGRAILTVVDRKIQHPKNCYTADDFGVKEGFAELDEAEYITNRA